MCGVSRRVGDERLEHQVGVVALDALQPPAVGEQRQERPVGAGQHLDAVRRELERGGVRCVGAPGDRVGEALAGEMGAPNSCSMRCVGDLELHRADGSEHRSLVAAPVRAQHLDDALLVELVDAAPELLVARRVLGAGRPRSARARSCGIGGKRTGSLA